jgi:hypothetical protein
MANQSGDQSGGRLYRTLAKPPFAVLDSCTGTSNHDIPEAISLFFCIACLPIKTQVMPSFHVMPTAQTANAKIIAFAVVDLGLKKVPCLPAAASEI